MNREKYFTKDQLDQMKKQYESMDKEILEKTEQEFNSVTEKLRNHMDHGTSATDKDVQDLAKQWKKHAEMFAPQNDSEFIKAAEKFHAENPSNELQYGVDAEIYKFIGKALQGNKDT